MSQLSSCLIPSGDPAQKIADSIINRPAILFSGQGSEEKGMGRELAEKDPEAMSLWKDAEKASGLPLREIYWDGDENAMRDTRALQPALTAANFNLWRAFEKKADLVPAATAGHSLGEYCALAAARVLSPKDAIEITALRGRLMSEADPERKGAMAAIVKLEDSVVMDIVKSVGAESGELIVAANFNTPTQTVVSGSREAVKLACQKARELKGRGVELTVSGAFHSPMLEEANRELQKTLDKTEWRNPRFPVYSNVGAKPVTTAEEAKKSVWRQMISPVFWVNLIRNLYLAGIRWWMEISPRAVLGKMVGPSLAGIAGQCDSLRVDLLNSLNSVINYAI